MNIKTREQAKALGPNVLAAWDAVMSRTTMTTTGIEVPTKKTAKGPNGENATELLFYTQRIEPLLYAKLIARCEFIGKNRKKGFFISERRKYTPDYYISVQGEVGTPICIEVKGSYFNNPKCEKLYQASKIRMDIAAEKHDVIFLLAIRDGKGWNVTQIRGKASWKLVLIPEEVREGLGMKCL